MPEEREQQNTPAEDELDLHLRFLLSPFGDEPSLRQREQSLQYLLAHADQAHPRLLEMLKRNPTALDAPAIIEVLPRFARSESVPLLEEIMSLGEEIVSRVAGAALAQHPDAGAMDALRRGLRSPTHETIIAAADGILLCGDRAACSELKNLVSHNDPIVRYHLIQAASKLDCFGRDELESLKQNETDADIRALITRKLAAMS